VSVVYGVHVIRSQNVAPIDVIVTRLDVAEWYAQTVSGDAGVLASAVTRFVVDELGQHTPTALYVAGERLELPDMWGGRYVWADAVRRRARGAAGLWAGRVLAVRCGCSESEIAAGHRHRCPARPPTCLDAGGLVGVSVVYGVHVIRCDEVAPVDVIFTSLGVAERRARIRSGETGVLGGAVTRFVVNELGQHTPTALFVAGKRQEVPHISDDRHIWANTVMPRYSHESPGSL